MGIDLIRASLQFLRCEFFGMNDGPSGPTPEQFRKIRMDETEQYLKDKFDTRFTPDFFDAQRKQYMDRQSPELEKQYRTASQSSALSLASQGLSQSSEAAKQAGALQTALDEARKSVVGGADAYVNNLRAQTASARNNISSFGADSDLSAVGHMAGAQADLLSRPMPFSPLADFFSGFVGPASLSAQQTFLRNSGSAYGLSAAATGKGRFRNVDTGPNQ